jgi:nitrogen fixation/metabolism regulation signal transduction histidine kinase
VKQRFSILMKIVSAIVVMLVIGTAASVVFTVRSERSNLLEATQRTLSVNTDLLLSTIQNLMLSGEAPILVRAMRSYQTIEGFSEISLYRANGDAAFSDDTTIDNVNDFQKKIHFERTPRSPKDTEDDPNLAKAAAGRTLVQAISTKEQSIEYFFPIINLTDCRQCHGRSGFVRGVLHLKLSLASVFDQIRSARDTLTLLLGSIGIVIALLLVLLINRLIVAPVLAIGGTVRLVGQGDLDARVSLRSRDELGVLGEALNQMIAGLRERNELAVRNRVIDTMNRENRKYLDSIQEGLILLDRQFVISEQYSLYLEKLFGTADIAGKSFVDFVYPDAAAQEEKRKELEQFLDILFTRTGSEMEMIMELNPLKDVTLVTGAEGGKHEIIVDTVYHRVLEGQRVVNVMVIFTDRTDLVRTKRDLEREKERSEAELAHIASILRAGPAAFQEFGDQAEETIQTLETSMERLEPGAQLDSLFRAMHSLKGAARYLEFRAIERSAHEVEQSLAAVRDGGAAAGPDLTVRLKEMIGTIRAEIGVVRDLIQRFRQFSVTPTAGEGAGGSDAAAVLVETLRAMSKDIAGELGKEVSFRSAGTLESAELARALRDPLIHLVRNAMDHGIEDPLERISAGKDKAGTVSLLFAKRKDQTVVRVTDDGAGIDFEAVRRRARELGLVGEDAAPSNAELTKLLFSPRFSSKGEPSAISGRGVGLDIVREAMHTLGGKISVTTRKGEGTSFTLSIPS